MTNWFDLPGPRSFLDDLVHSCLSGVSVALQCPATIRGSWAQYLRRDRSPSERLEELPREVSRAGEALNALTRALLFEEEAEEASGFVRRTRDIVLSRHVRGRHFVVEAELETSWRNWSTVLTDWARAAQSIPDACDRPTLMVVFPGASNELMPPADSLLRVVRWSAIGQRADFLQYAILRISPRNLSRLQRDTAVAVAAYVAGFDYEVVDRLAEEPLDAIINPEVPLRDMARERGWHAGELNGRSFEWRLGMSDSVQGRDFVHSAVLAALADRGRLRRRVWEGQLGVLLPFVEERRTEILDAISGTGRSLAELRARTRVAFTDLYDLEIGDLYAMREDLRRYLPSRVIESIEPLRRIRNDLAHLRHVPAEYLHDTRILACDDGAA